MTSSPPAPVARWRRPAGAVGCVVEIGGLIGVGRDELTLLDPARGLAVVAVRELAGPVSALASDAGRLAIGRRGAVELWRVDGGVPALESTVVTGGRVDGVALVGDDLWVADGAAITAWHLAPGGAVRGGRCAIDLAGRLVVAGRRLVVAAEHEGVAIVDVTDADAPAVVACYRGPGDATRVAVAGGCAYVADYTGGVHVVDVADPRRPARLAIWTGSMVGDLVAIGARLYLAAGALEVLDVSKPDRPRSVWRDEEGADLAWALACAGETLVTIGGDGACAWRLADLR